MIRIAALACAGLLPSAGALRRWLKPLERRPSTDPMHASATSQASQLHVVHLVWPSFWCRSCCRRSRSEKAPIGTRLAADTRLVPAPSRRRPCRVRWTSDRAVGHFASPRVALDRGRPRHGSPGERVVVLEGRAGRRGGAARKPARSALRAGAPRSSSESGLASGRRWRTSCSIQLSVGSTAARTRPLLGRRGAGSSFSQLTERHGIQWTASAVSIHICRRHLIFATTLRYSGRLTHRFVERGRPCGPPSATTFGVTTR